MVKVKVSEFVTLVELFNSSIPTFADDPTFPQSCQIIWKIGVFIFWRCFPWNAVKIFFPVERIPKVIKPLPVVSKAQLGKNFREYQFPFSFILKHFSKEWGSVGTVFDLGNVMDFFKYMLPYLKLFNY